MWALSSPNQAAMGSPRSTRQTATQPR